MYLMVAVLLHNLLEVIALLEIQDSLFLYLNVLCKRKQKSQSPLITPKMPLSYFFLRDPSIQKKVHMLLRNYFYCLYLFASSAIRNETSLIFSLVMPLSFSIVFRASSMCLELGYCFKYSLAISI
jgi:hypothetical protein